MGNYVLSQKAIEDLASIWNYTFETWSEKQADTYYYSILEVCNKIAEGKLIGKKYWEISDEANGYKIGQHIIFYRTSEINQFEIIRILHSSMDLKNRFTK